MEHPTRARVQFFLDGPFSNVMTLSLTFYDGSGEELEVLVDVDERPQYQLWSRILDMCAQHERRHGVQQRMF